MKKIILLTLALIPLVIYGQDGYRPLVEEGKHWTYDNFMPLRPAKYDHYYQYELKGDTVISEISCLKMYSENLKNDGTTKYEGALYEKEKKVYCFYPGKSEAVVLYDFGCKVGETFYTPECKMLVVDIRTVDNSGIAVRQYTLEPSFEEYSERIGEVYWIEGVGATKDFFNMLPLTGNYNTLNACELNGEQLYHTVEPDLTEPGYHKMGVDGKQWNYVHYYVDKDGEHRDPYCYVVKGDTLIRRTTYKKLYYQDEKTERPVCLLYEEGRCVMKGDFGDNSYDMPIMRAFFDFGRDDFGRVFSWESAYGTRNTNWMVRNVETIEANSRTFRRYTCLQKYSDAGQQLATIEDAVDVWHDVWVEGIGSAVSGIEDQIPSHEPPTKTPEDYTYFVSCYENGECIFTAEDFAATTSLNPVNKAIDNVGRLAVYDLQGRQLKSLPHKGIYIRNGKKVVIK